MSESGLSPEDQEATPSADETPTDVSPASDEPGTEASLAAEKTPAEAVAEPGVASTDGAAATEEAAVASAPAARSGGRRRALSWAAVIAVGVVVVLLTTTLLVSHQAPAQLTTSGHATATAAAAPAPFSVYGYIGGSVGPVNIQPVQGTPPSLQGTPLPISPFATQDNERVFALKGTDGSLRWSYPLPDAAFGQVVANGVVYTGSTTGAVYALDAGTGKLLWTTTLLKSSYVQQVVDGVVYVANNILGTNREVYALDAKTGKHLWNTAVDNLELVADGTVYVTVQQGDDNNPTFFLYALNASTGAERWHFQGKGSVTLAAATDGLAYVMDQQSVSGSTIDGMPVAIPRTTLDVLDASTGTQRWAYPKNPGGKLSLVGVESGMVYLLSVNFMPPSFGPNTLEGLNIADGSTRWKVEVPLQEVSGPPTPGGPDTQFTFAALSSVGMVSSGMVYLGSLNTPVAAYNASTGAVLWIDTEFPGITRFPSLSIDTVADGVVYVENGSGTLAQGLYAVSASTGKVLWKMLGKLLKVSTVKNGLAYISSSDFGPPITASRDDNGVFAVDTSTGAVRWTYKLGKQTATILAQ